MGGGNGLLTCNTLPKSSKEKCNAIDDDCDGKTDELAEMPITDSPISRRSWVCWSTSSVQPPSSAFWTLRIRASSCHAWPGCCSGHA
jgi:hypothetical protein